MNLLSHLDLQQVHELKGRDWPVSSIGRTIEAYSMEQMIRQEAPSVVLISVCENGEEYLLMLIRELIKDLENIKGDLAQNYKTIPVIYGVTILNHFALSFFLLEVCYAALNPEHQYKNNKKLSICSYFLKASLLLPARTEK